MQKLLFTFCLLFGFGVAIQAQHLAHQPPKFEYCSFEGREDSAFKLRPYVTLENGDDKKDSESMIRDEKGDKKPFHSNMEVCNFLGEAGWELVAVDDNRLIFKRLKTTD